MSARIATPVRITPLVLTWLVDLNANVRLVIMEIHAIMVIIL